MPYAMETREDPKVGLAAEILRNCGEVRLELRGTSMLPSLWPGDLLTIQLVAHGDIVPGDIVLVLRDQRFIVHRVVKRQQVQNRISWITRGDAVPHNDAPIAGSELLGCVTGIARGSCNLVPRRRLSWPGSTLAWMLCRWSRFRGLLLRLHVARLQPDPMRAARVFCRLLAANPAVAGISPSRTSHL
jgi:signal peptidase I